MNIQTQSPNQSPNAGDHVCSEKQPPYTLGSTWKCSGQSSSAIPQHANTIHQIHRSEASDTLEPSYPPARAQPDCPATDLNHRVADLGLKTSSGRVSVLGSSQRRERLTSKNFPSSLGSLDPQPLNCTQRPPIAGQRGIEIRPLSTLGQGCGSF